MKKRIDKLAKKLYNIDKLRDEPKERRTAAANRENSLNICFEAGRQPQIAKGARPKKSIKPLNQSNDVRG